MAKEVLDPEIAYGRIYTVTNSVNGKQYVGQTIGDVTKRFRAHLSTSNCTYLHKSIQKYGKENFILSVVDCADDKESLNEREKYWAEKLNTYAPNGYNLREAGGSKGKSHPDSVKRMLETSSKNKKPMSKENREKSAARMRELWLDSDYREKTIRNLKDKLTGRKIPAERVERGANKKRGRKQSEEVIEARIDGYNSIKPNYKNKTSKYKGVYFCKHHKKWIVSIRHKSKCVFKKYCNTETEAAALYNQHAPTYFGESCYINIIEEL